MDASWINEDDIDLFALIRYFGDAAELNTLFHQLRLSMEHYDWTGEYQRCTSESGLFWFWAMIKLRSSNPQQSPPWRKLEQRFSRLRGKRSTNSSIPMI